MTNYLNEREQFFKGAENNPKLDGVSKVKVKRLHPDAIIPKKALKDDAGFDLVAVEDTIIEPNETKLIKTGLAVELPPGYEMQIRPRSGVTLKTNLRVQLGTVDANYRGEVGVIVDNVYALPPGTFKIFGNSYSIDGSVIADLYCKNKHKSYFIRKGDRIAQAVIQRLPAVEMVEVEELSESERGAGGFGSTGVKAERGGV